MLESIHFHYDGIGSKEMGLLNVQMDSGLFEEHFAPSRSIKTMSIRGRDEHYFQSIEYDPLSLPLTFYIEEKLSEEQAHQLNRWFHKKYYKPFYFDDFPDRIYYLMYQGNPRIFHSGMNGYFDIEMVSNSPYSYSPTYTTFMEDFTGSSTHEYRFENNGDIEIKPEIWIDKVGSGSIRILNTNNGSDFKIDNLVDGETIYIDGENEEIETDLSNTYRYEDHNDNFLEFDYGVNRLHIEGQCRLQFRYRYKFLR